MRSGFGAVLLAGLLVCAGCEQAATPVANSPAPADTSTIATQDAATTDTTLTAPVITETVATGTAAVQAFVDPATGELREPTTAELAAANRARTQAQAVTSAASTSVTVTVLPNGMTEYDLGTRAHVEETACIQSDGSLGECTATQRAALRKTAQQKAP